MEINKPITTIIILIITLLLVFLFLVPKYQESRDLKTTFAKKQAEYSGKSAYFAEISKIIEDIDGRKYILEKIDSALPSKFSFAQLIYFLQKKGAEAGIVNKSIIFSQVSPASLEQNSSVTFNRELNAKEPNNITITLDLSGSYQAFKKFLSSLEKSSRLFEVESISFTSASKSSKESVKSQNQLPTYNFKLVITTHTY